jgi:hypothetical protein
VGGANAGQACTTDEVVFVEQATGDENYAVSRDCLPGGLPASVKFTVNVVTGTSTQMGTCPGQTDADACTGGSMGISQSCCSDDDTKRCFPYPLSRTGTPFPPSPTKAAKKKKGRLDAACASALRDEVVALEQEIRGL